MLFPEVLFVGWFNFPEGTAGAQYVHGLGKALRAGGHSVGYVVEGSTGRDQDRREDGSYWFDGFPYYPLGLRRPPQLLHRLFVTVGGPLASTLAWLESQDLRGVRHIFTYSGSCAFLLKLRALCARRKLTLTNLVVEWYSPRQLLFGNPFSWSSRLLDSEFQRYGVNRLLRNVVCISRYLHQYYSRRGCLSVNIPHLLDLNDDKWPNTTSAMCESNSLNLVFAGSGGRTDLLHNAIRGLSLLEDKAKDVRITICGPSRDDLARLLGDQRSLLNHFSGQLNFRGRLPHRQALAEVARSDFWLMLRPDARFTRAGFPTKLGESLACGVPLLGNVTGDVGHYVADGIEGILVPDCAPESFAQGVKRALALSATARHTMRINARKRAAVSFDYRNSVQSIHEFLDCLWGKTKSLDY